MRIYNEIEIYSELEFGTCCCPSRTLKIQRPSSGGDLPQPQVRRVNSTTHTVLMDDELENGNLGPYADKPRTFPNMRSKAYTPLVWTSILSIYISKSPSGLIYTHLYHDVYLCNSLVDMNKTM